MRSGALRLVVLLSSAVGLACGLVAADASADTVTSKLVASGNALVPSIATAQWVSDDGRYLVFNGPTGLTLADTVASTNTPIAGAGHPCRCRGSRTSARSREVTASASPCARTGRVPLPSCP